MSWAVETAHTMLLPVHLSSMCNPSYCIHTVFSASVSHSSDLSVSHSSGLLLYVEVRQMLCQKDLTMHAQTDLSRKAKVLLHTPTSFVKEPQNRHCMTVMLPWLL